MKQLQPHQALPEGIPLGQAVPVQKHDGTGRMSSPKRRRGRHGAKFTANGGFKFLLLTFQYLVGWEI